MESSARAAGSAQQTTPQLSRLWGKTVQLGDLGLDPARSPAGSTKPLTLKEIIGRKQRVQGLQAGEVMCCRPGL